MRQVRQGDGRCASHLKECRAGALCVARLSAIVWTVMKVEGDTCATHGAPAGSAVHLVKGAPVWQCAMTMCGPGFRHLEVGEHQPVEREDDPTVHRPLAEGLRHTHIGKVMEGSWKVHGRFTPSSPGRRTAPHKVHQISTRVNLPTVGEGKGKVHGVGSAPCVWGAWRQAMVHGVGSMWAVHHVCVWGLAAGHEVEGCLLLSVTVCY